MTQETIDRDRATGAETDGNHGPPVEPEPSTTEMSDDPAEVVMKPTLFGKRWRIRYSGHWDKLYYGSEDDHAAWRFSSQDGGKVVRA